MAANNNKKLIILTAPSGAGKTSITHFLLNKFSQLSFSISAATRQAREGEVDGKDYHFISVNEFREEIKNDAFVEWEMVYEGKYYGTLKKELQRIWSLNKIPVLDIDVKGAIHVQQQFPQTTLSIFIQPPSIEELKKRLEARKTETPESIATRINKATYEISFKQHFTKIIVNDLFENACKEAEETVNNFLG
ncbi:MAG: guanylate kinase [Bacteroidetes bacterium]|nr:guanylate kinase [Bacteroidota bacterium]MBS1669974.1 guanylate kinase [Bacteroidota bacterium]